MVGNRNNLPVPGQGIHDEIQVTFGVGTTYYVLHFYVLKIQCSLHSYIHVVHTYGTVHVSSLV